MASRDLDLAEKKKWIIRKAKANLRRQIIREIKRKLPLSSDGGPH